MWLDMYERRCVRAVVRATRMDRMRSKDKEEWKTNYQPNWIDECYCHNLEVDKWEMDDKEVMKAEVVGNRTRGRPWFIWMDGVRKAMVVIGNEVREAGEFIKLEECFVYGWVNFKVAQRGTKLAWFGGVNHIYSFGPCWWYWGLHAMPWPERRTGLTRLSWGMNGMPGVTLSVDSYYEKHGK